MDRKTAKKRFRFSNACPLIIFMFCLFIVGSLEAQNLNQAIHILKSRDPAVRQEAARVLGEQRDVSAVGSLITVLRTDDDCAVKASAEDALVKIGAPAVESLIPLTKDSEWRIRRRTVRILGIIGDPRAVEPLAAVLKNDKDGCVRKFSARALGEIGNSRSVEILNDALNSKNLEVVEGAYRFFICRGEPGSESLLIEALNHGWNKKMAIDYAHCGNIMLEEAASEWAKMRAERCPYLAKTLQVTWKTPKWGQR